DPTSGTYKSIDTEATQVLVKPGTPSSTQNRDYSAGATSKTSTAMTHESTDLTPVLPRDPVSGLGWGMKPISLAISLGSFILLVILVIGAWLRKAFQRVPLTEPYRVQRLSLAEMKKTVDQVETNPLVGLRLWRKATMEFLMIHKAVPTSDEVAEAVIQWGGVSSEWKDLWEKSEERLFSKNEVLDRRWVDSANAAHLTLRIPKINRWRLFRIENLFPMIILGILLMVTGVQGEDFNELYRSGKFDEGKSLSIERLKHNPSDWLAHSRLSLCLIQKGEWNQAYAHALSAWLLNPSNKDLRWNLEVSYQQSHFPESGIEALYRTYWNPAGWFSVFTWQGVAASGGVLLIIGLFRMMNASYHPSLSQTKKMDQILMSAGVILLILSLFSISQFGVFSSPRVMVLVQEVELKSIPTDLPEGVQSRKVPAGTVVTLQKEFLGWAKVRLSQKEEGWMRKSNGILLYDGYAE
ncbi:MAG: hypothetical protein V4507_03240, partial [Verrucomicrobiota bacterium]